MLSVLGTSCSRVRITSLRCASTYTWNPPPIPVVRLRPPSKRERWVDKMKRMGFSVRHISLAGGYAHQALFEVFQDDARAMNVKFLFRKMKRRLTDLGESTNGDYVELRKRLDDRTQIFSDYLKHMNAQKEQSEAVE
eukprot:TRINITY_DN3906_c0_g1_i1.p1 TRINITY_DN3906_c0_g1~~TRINITY_DN3906_c0_g1_i1.p1  ORF type:complete len:137 (-),score=11.39 TRINITY_DN3906_c0_g1_i1:630-1040(-)